MIDGYQQITDFEVGDVVRRSAHRYYDPRIGNQGDKFVVTGVFPGDNGTHEIPDRVGRITVEGSGEAYGHLLFDSPRTEDNASPQDLRDEIAYLRATVSSLERERAAAQQQAREAMESFEQIRSTFAESRRRLTSDVEQAQAAQALEAHRANKAIAAEHRAVRLLAYATSLMGSRKRGMVQGFAAGLDAER